MSDTESSSSPDLALRRMQTKTHLRISRCLTALDAQIRAGLEQVHAEGITAQQSRVLLLLFEARKPLTARSLAARMGVSEVTMSRFIQALQASEWISRQRNPQDGRSYLIAPTNKARGYLRDFVAISNHVLDQTYEGFSEEEIDLFHELVARIQSNLQLEDHSSDTHL